MSEIVLTTFDWVPEMPRGYVRDLRVRWALEEAALAYRVESTPFRDRGPDHFAHQPFGQAPWLTHGDLSIFESGAILLHLGELSDKLMPVIDAAAATPRNGCSQRSLLSRPRASPGPSSCSQVTRAKRQCESFLMTSSISIGSSTWKQSWTEANGWLGPSP